MTDISVNEAGNKTSCVERAPRGVAHELKLNLDGCGKARSQPQMVLHSNSSF